MLKDGRQFPATTYRDPVTSLTVQSASIIAAGGSVERA
jgi:hypothetical protein